MPDPIFSVGSGILLALPEDVSALLPRRGPAAVRGTIKGAPFRAVLEPDGQGSHWFKVRDALRAAANADVGDPVTLEIAPTTDWPEPAVPTDLARCAGSVSVRGHPCWLLSQHSHSSLRRNRTSHRLWFVVRRVYALLARCRGRNAP
jgi:hypothetical protein